MDKIEQGSAKAVAISELIDWVRESWVDPPRATNNPLTLPAMQRDGVWRPNQVLGLWHSVLAGLPIGIFYLQEGDACRDIVAIADGGKATKAGLKGYDLIDGQQRIRALALGIPEWNQEERCLWVKFTGNTYELLLTSRAQPFGYGKDGRRLSLDTRRTAREEIEGKDGPLAFLGATPERSDADKVYDSDLFDHRIEGKEGELPCPPFPFDCKKENTVQLSTLLSAYMQHGEPAWRDVAPTEAALAVLDALGQGFGKLCKRGAVLMVLEDTVLQGDGLSDFFRRVGAGGTPLSEAEQLFSAFKAVKPDLRTVVKDIQADVSAVFSPAQVMTAILRIANVRSKDRSVRSPGFDQALKAIRDQDATGNTLAGELQSLVAGPEVPIRKAFRDAKTLLSDGKDPFKLSDIILATLRPELWQVLVFWCLDHGAQEGSRAEMVRFALFWKFGVNYPESAARLCFEHLAELSGTPNAVFSGRELYTKLVRIGAAVGLADPKLLREIFTKDSDSSTWLSHAKRFTGNGKTVQTAIQWWYAVHMLEWSQRSYLDRAFPGFQPLTDHEDDIPYDKDHICARVHWRHDGRGDPVQFGGVPSAVQNAMREAREHLGNAIGNYRLIGSSENRSDGALPIRDKMLFWSEDKDRGNAGTAKDFFLDYEDSRTDWMNADGEKLTWPESRLQGFQAAVANRTATLYEDFLKVFHEDWMLPEDTAASSGKPNA